MLFGGAGGNRRGITGHVPETSQAAVEFLNAISGRNATAVNAADVLMMEQSRLMRRPGTQEAPPSPICDCM